MAGGGGVAAAGEQATQAKKRNFMLGQTSAVNGGRSLPPSDTVKSGPA